MSHAGFRPLTLIAAFMLVATAAMAQRSPLQAEFATASALPEPANAKHPAPPGDTVHFTHGHSFLTKTAVEIIVRQAEWLKAHPDVKVRLECHTDDGMDEMTALSFGDTRCRAVETILIKHGISAARITAMSVGNQKPAVPDAKTAAEHAENRRVVTHLVVSN